MKAITNGKLILPDERGEFQIVEHQAILYDTKIEEIVPEMSLRGDSVKLDEVIDAHGAYVSPGFINIHLHGCVGCTPWTTIRRLSLRWRCIRRRPALPRCCRRR